MHDPSHQHPSGPAPNESSPDVRPDRARSRSPRTSPSSSLGAFFVALGILLSRIMGLVRERVFAHYLGNSMPAAAFKAALRIPNFLQNLLGEGVLSASFIPVYAALNARGDREEADRVASAVFGLLSLVVALLVGLGVVATPYLIDLIVPGFEGEPRTLTIDLVRILFPGVGFLVFSAWCLGVLNSHRRLFLSYVAPVIWNAAIIVGLLLYREDALSDLAVKAAVATSIGSLLQFAVQLPPVLRLLGRFRPTVSVRRASVRQVLRSFGPVVLGRGVVQVSGYVDQAIASLLSALAVSAFSYAQTLYLLPVSIFGMAVSAAELPAMSEETSNIEDVRTKLRARLLAALPRIAFFVVPSAAALFFLGDVINAAILQTGRFGPEDVRYVWAILAAAALGLLASASGRLYASAFYAQRDTRTPLRFAIVRVTASGVLAYVLVLELPDRLGLAEAWAAAGIAAASAVGAWIELLLLRRALEARCGARIRHDRTHLLTLIGVAIVAALLAVLVKRGLVSAFGPMPGLEDAWWPPPSLHPVVTGVAVLGAFGVAYGVLTTLARVPQAIGLLDRVLRRARSRR